MPWCPICKCEYKKGIDTCVDCNVELVRILKEDREKEEERERTQMTSEELFRKPTRVYMDNEEQVKLSRASSHALLIVAMLGTTFLLCMWLDMFPIYRSMATKLMLTAVLGVVFLAFYIMSYMGMKDTVNFVMRAERESDYKKNIDDYCEESLSPELIDEMADFSQFDELTEEEKFFLRNECIKNLLQDKFPTYREEYIDHMCEEIYTKLYQE